MSYANLPSDLVLAAAERYLADREKMLQGWEDEAVERRIRDSEPNFLTRLFGAQRITREEAFKDYQDSMEQRFHRIHGARWAQDAKGVLVLAKKAVESGIQTVALSSDLARVFDESGAFSKE